MSVEAKLIERLAKSRNHAVSRLDNVVGRLAEAMALADQCLVDDCVETAIIDVPQTLTYGGLEVLVRLCHDHADISLAAEEKALREDVS
jgi:hypothetical protein